MALVEFEKRGGVGVIRFSRPPMNQVSAELGADLEKAIAQAESPDVRAVVVTGSPNFCAGADITDFIAAHQEGRRSGLARELSRVLRRLEQLEKPTIAAVRGYALGGGCETALACDFRVLADDAKVGQPEILLGLIPGAGGTQRLGALVGMSRAKEICFSGRFLGAAEAERIGLADRVVPEPELEANALGWAEQLAQGPTVAIAAAKRAVHASFELDRDAGLEVENEQFDRAFATRDAREGCRSFKDKGPGKAKFEGR